MISKTIGFRGFLYFQTHPNEPRTSKPFGLTVPNLDHVHSSMVQHGVLGSTHVSVKCLRCACSWPTVFSQNVCNDLRERSETPLSPAKNSNVLNHLAWIPLETLWLQECLFAAKSLSQERNQRVSLHSMMENLLLSTLKGQFWIGSAS